LSTSSPKTGHAYVHLDDDASEDEEHDVGFMTLAAARQVAEENGAELEIDGPTREEWDE
jgi:hypothetical protein